MIPDIKALIYNQIK